MGGRATYQQGSASSRFMASRRKPPSENGTRQRGAVANEIEFKGCRCGPRTVCSFCPMRRLSQGGVGWRRRKNMNSHSALIELRHEARFGHLSCHLSICKDD